MKDTWEEYVRMSCEKRQKQAEIVPLVESSLVDLFRETNRLRSIDISQENYTRYEEYPNKYVIFLSSLMSRLGVEANTVKHLASTSAQRGSTISNCLLKHSRSQTVGFPNCQFLEAFASNSI